MKKNTWMRIASMLFVLTILSTCMISGSYAKYSVKMQGSSETQVAKFNFSVHDGNDTEFSTGSAVSVNLLGSITPNTSGTVAEDRIAPGCSGVGKLVLDASDCEVSVDLTSDVTVTDNDIPLMFYVSTTEQTSGISYVTTASKLAGVIKQTISDMGTIGCNDTDKVKTIYLYWIWNPNSTNASDSALINGGTAPSFVVDVDVTATQHL